MSEFGNDRALSTAQSNQIQIKGKGIFMPCCCINAAASRTYFYVFENAVEYNTPSTCLLIPPNMFCRGTDMISKVYFDRGIWYDEGVCHKTGCVSGTPKFYVNNVRNVCLCMDCCECWNSFIGGHCTYCCGDRIIYSPFDYYCCCCPVRSFWCSNCCGLCGPKDGELLWYCTYHRCLLPGSGGQLADMVNNSRADWGYRIGRRI
mmetsp:Transcript_933/g.1570  ORF Transcript_933/g.1570 Transcript_933/m.1570 type:complete len:204 (-) Transcript_933:83-694(-)